MSRITVNLDSAGVRQLLKSDEVQEYLHEVANGIKGRCSGDYKVDSRTGKYRTITRIKTNNEKTFRKNLKENELLKSLR